MGAEAGLQWGTASGVASARLPAGAKPASMQQGWAQGGGGQETKQQFVLVNVAESGLL